MPYIKRDLRFQFDDAIEDMTAASTAGDLNYIFTKLALKYLAEHGRNYQHINDVVGALEGAKMEFYRRLAAPYEDTKIAENGDVY